MKWQLCGKKGFKKQDLEKKISRRFADIRRGATVRLGDAVTVGSSWGWERARRRQRWDQRLGGVSSALAE